ncbi:MAG: macrolide ABC transporter ATP-binding protein [Candidatus Omnitrophica bacterium CG11_big_fil_rev_8_21_14_0_20_42_13]|uniref:Macrolide ABC transporter ATP-binding protein n=1 Tax=Candidatus Ghiorseimicrobium undicola TaxID=1974746 RepID=A0A2H0LYK2_9BACT|nr:MAG: macrolide ABC transporter ATP-binding protein [Candidatus Omnitrophica bacterium CG11_big_fil_rev_8_21_14_0_20_42_13]
MLIQIRNLTKIYKVDSIETPALRGINLDIERGEFLTIAGPSGSGKTSLLNIIGGLDTLTSGAVLYENTDITKISISRLASFRLKQIGFVFQAYNLINTLTAVENVEYVMLLQGVDVKTRRQRAVSMLERVGLGEYIKRFPNEMSGGQQQRVAVARAIAAHPKVVLADEPTANLDSKSGEALIGLMRQLNEEKNITFIFSTHDKMVMDKAKRQVFIRDGEIQK